MSNGVQSRRPALFFILINIFICIYSLSVKLVIGESDNDECTAAVQHKPAPLRRFPRINQSTIFQIILLDGISTEKV